MTAWDGLSTGGKACGWFTEGWMSTTALLVGLGGGDDSTLASGQRLLMVEEAIEGKGCVEKLLGI